MELKSYFIRFPKGRTKALTFSYDDGAQQDIRLAGIFDSYGMKATFNLNSGLMAKDESQGNINGRLTLSQAKKLFRDSQHEVAIHGYLHNRMESAPYAYGIRDAVKDRETLEDIFERPIRGMAYPYGGFSDKLIKELKTAGIVYARTVNSTGKFNIPLSEDDWMRLNPTCHHNSDKLTEYGDMLIASNEQHYPLLMNVWGHSSDFDISNNWEVIENFCRQMSGRDDIWYASNIEIYDYFDAFNNLICSSNFSRIYNPSAISVWISANNKVLEIKPGVLTEI